MGFSKNDVPAIILDGVEHARVTAVLRREIPHLTVYKPENKQMLWESYQKAYTDLRHPEWLDYIRKYFQ